MWWFVCVCCKNSLHLKLLNIKYLQECITFELMIGAKDYSFIILYISPSKYHDDVEIFMKNSELNLEEINKKPFLNCRSW